MSTQKPKQFVNVDSFSIPPMPIEGFDPNVDPTAAKKPVPDGVYQAKIEFTSANADERWEQKVSQAGNAYLQAEVLVTITDGPYKGRKVYDSVRTVPFKVDEVFTTITGLLIRALGEVPTADAFQQASALNRLLPGEAKVGVKIEGYSSGLGKTVFNGERSIPRKFDNDRNDLGPDFDTKDANGGDIRFSNRLTGRFERI